MKPSTFGQLLILQAILRYLDKCPVGQQMTAALAGSISVKEALAAAQVAADREMKAAGYS